MSTRNRLVDLEEWIGRMVECARGPESESTLLLAVQRCASARAVGLWRELTGLDRSQWIEARARGPEEWLPTKAQVRAVLEAGLDGELGERTRVLRAGPPGARVALALGGMGPSQEGVDQAEALLAVHVNLAPADTGRARVSAALPLRDAVRRGHDPLRAARRVIAAEAGLFANRSIELEALGFDAEQPRSTLDEEQLADLVCALLLRARRRCDAAGAGPHHVVIRARACGRDLVLTLETDAAGPLGPLPHVSDPTRASVLRAAGTLDVELPSERSERLRIRLPGDSAA